MKCTEARKLLLLHLDSELDAQSALEVEQHLESCAECAGLFDAEKKFGDRIASALRKGESTPALWTTVGSRIRPAQRVVSIFGWPMAATASAAVVLLVAVWLVRASRPLDLATAAGECHNAYVQQITSPEFNGPLPEWIARELDNHLDAAAFDYRPTTSGFHTEGARFCHVANVPTALILGHYENVPNRPLSIRRALPRRPCRLHDQRSTAARARKFAQERDARRWLKLRSKILTP